MAGNLQPISSDGGFTSGGNININNGAEIVTTINEDLNIVVQDEEDDGWSLYQTITDGLGTNLARTSLDRSSFTIDLEGGDQWQFDGKTLQTPAVGAKIRGYDANLAVQVMQGILPTTASLQAISNQNDPNIFSTFDATITAANIKVYNGGSNGGVGYAWQFDNQGNLTFPRDDANADPILVISGGTEPSISSVDASLAGPANLDIIAQNTIFSGFSGDEIRIYPDDGEIGSTGNLQLWANAGSNTQYSWTFGTDGMLTVPYEGVIRSNDDTIILQSYDTSNLTSRSMRLGTNGALYLEENGPIPTNNRTWLTINPNAGNTEITAVGGILGSTAGGNLSIAGGDAFQDVYTTSPGGNVNITGGLGGSDDGGGGGPGGSVNISAGLSADPVGVAGNVVITTGGTSYTFNELTLNVTTNPPASPAPILNGFGIISAPEFSNSGDNVTINANSKIWTFDSTGNLTLPNNIIFNSNVYMNLGFTLSTLPDIGGQVDYNNRTVGYVADNNGSASLYARDSAGLGDNNAVITANATNGTATILVANAALSNKTWTFDGSGTFTTPGNIIMADGATLKGTGASPAPKISGFDSASFGGNLSAANLTVANLTANATALFGPSASANFTRFPHAQVVISNVAAGIQQNESGNIGLISEATANSANTSVRGVGVYGVGYTVGGASADGIDGEGHVSDTNDTGTATGVRGYSYDTHAGGVNIGVYASALNGATNYALYMKHGNIISDDPQTWTLADNNASSLSFNATGKTGILDIVTTNGSEGVTMSGSLSVTGASGANITANLTVNGAGGVSIPNLPAFRVYGSVSTDIPGGTTVTSTQGATVDYNQGSYYNNTTGIFTAPVSGIYSCAATLRVGSTSGMNQASIQKNSDNTGANVIAFWELIGNSSSNGFGHMSMAGMAKLAVGDTIRLQVITGNVQFDSNDSWSVSFLG